MVLYWNVTGPIIRTIHGAPGTVRSKANDKHLSGWVNHENRTVDLDRNGSRHGTVRGEHRAARAAGRSATGRRRAPRAADSQRGNTCTRRSAPGGGDHGYSRLTRGVTHGQEEVDRCG